MSYTLVQHSLFTFGGHSEFRHTVETKSVTPEQAPQVLKAGGTLFESFKEALRVSETENYPSNAGTAPRCQGTFSGMKIDGLRVYVPAGNDTRVR